jgi:uncharacterized protein (TIGR03083 family)
MDEAGSARAEVLAMLDSLSAEQFDAPTINEGWSVKDTAAHLASIEARVRLMLETVLNGGTWAADRADLNAFNARAVEERRSWSADTILQEIRDTGRETANLFARLTADDLDREWVHPIFGDMTIERTAAIIAGHLRSHARDLRLALQR